MDGPHASPVGEFAAAVAQRLREGLDADEFDLIVEEDASTIAADDWSLRFESHTGDLAWLAIDTEPDDPRQYEAVLHRVVTKATRHMLSAIDRESDGRLTTLLKASGDPFSIAFATTIEGTR